MGLKRQIVIEIDEDNNVTLETKGFKGPECVEEIKKVTKNIAKIDSTKKTKEYYEKSKNQLKKTITKKVSRFSK